MRTLNTVVLLTLVLQGGAVSSRGSSSVSSLSLASSLAQVSDLEVEEKPMRRLCGWRLANKLNQVCRGIYNKPGVTSNDLFYRSMRGELLNDVKPQFGIETELSSTKDTQLGLVDSPKNEKHIPSSGRSVPPEIMNDNFRYLFPTAEGYNYYLEGRDNDGIALEGYIRKGKERLPFLSSEVASQMFVSHPRSKRGLSAECCRKACRISELMGYCQ